MIEDVASNILHAQLSFVFNLVSAHAGVKRSVQVGSVP
jgi:hypothetical protein